MVICPVRVTYNDVMVIFAPDRKTAFKLANRATFAIAKSLIYFEFYISLKKFTFLVRWWHVQSAVHVTTRLVWSAELTHPTKILANKKQQHQLGNSSLAGKSPITSSLCFGSLLKLSFFSKICRMVTCPIRVTYNHAVVFFTQLQR